MSTKGTRAVHSDRYAAELTRVALASLEVASYVYNGMDLFAVMAPDSTRSD
eukprot:COSAG05_NODE_1930_length_3818_cov_2.245227_2_plen_51_part_00